MRRGWETYYLFRGPKTRIAVLVYLLSMALPGRGWKRRAVSEAWSWGRPAWTASAARGGYADDHHADQDLRRLERGVYLVRARSDPWHPARKAVLE